MKKYTDRIENDRLRQLCIENDWFTSGTNEQYDRLFTLNGSGARLDTIAALIWACSSGADLDDITAQLEEASAWPIYVGYIMDKLEMLEFGETERAIIREALTTHPDAGKAYRVIL